MPLSPFLFCTPAPVFRQLFLRLALGPLLLSGVAFAQTAALNAGVSLNQATQPVLSLGLGLRNVTLLGGFGLDARLQGDIGPGGGLELSGLLDWPLDDLSERLTLYGGPGAALNFGGGIRLRPSLLLGLNYDLDGQSSLYGEGSYQFQGQFRIRAGVQYLF